ncbi:hypothetical protein AN958_06443 [Leucoagaricus sp. SymC.cos]|nr:hypothetical protein AN958_06443 [Leucoagaricus sp. SymC.cos]
MMDGLVLVHSQMEVRACTVACACLMKQRRLAPDEAFSAIEDALPLFNPTVNFSRNLELYDACGCLPTRDHPVVREWLSSDGPEVRFNGTPSSPSSSSESGYPRRPSGSIITSETYRSPSREKSYQTSPPRTNSMSSSPSQSIATHQKSTSLSSRPRHTVVGSSEMDLEAHAMDILSNTGFDLSEFADALKEIERNQGQRGRSIKGNFGARKTQQGGKSLCC